MVVMVTPVAFATIGYQTYIIFAVINAFIVPCVYFCYPETAYRSLEEMDEIFWKSSSIFDVVNNARPSVTPNRYDKNGHLLINYLDTEEHRRRSSIAPQDIAAANEKSRLSTIENGARARHDEGYNAENGFAGVSGSSSEKNE